ncbi:hypothetical protein [Longimicrobium sp.]
MKASREQQLEWMTDTIEFLGERFSSLTPKDLKELENIGMRFCSPVISNAEAVETAEAQQEPAAA